MWISKKKFQDVVEEANGLEKHILKLLSENIDLRLKVEILEVENAELRLGQKALREKINSKEKRRKTNDR